MAEGVFDEVVTAVERIASDVEHLVGTAVRDMFGGGGANGNVDAVRWEGMSNDQLAAAVRRLNAGPGASGVAQAADALSAIAGDLQQIETTLHQQLQAIGVNWQSEASELAQEMTTESAAYTTSAGAASGANAAAVNAQGEAYAAAKNAVPNPSVLTGSASTTAPVSFLSAAGSILTGHNTDQAQAASTTKAARQQTIDALNTYTATSQSHVTSHQPLSTPPTVRLTPTPVDTGIGQSTTTAGYVPPTVTVPSGGVPGSPGLTPVGGTSPVDTGLPVVSGAVPPVTGGGLPGTPAGGLPGSPFGGVPGIPTGTSPGLPVAGGAPGSGPGAGPGAGPGGGGPGVRMPGAPGAGGPGTPLSPGPISGIGPNVPPAGGASGAAAAASGAIGSSLVEDAAVGSAIVGGTVGAGIGGAAARKDELVRSRDLVPDPEAPESSDARSQAARALAELEGEEAAEAGVSARIGATAELPPTLLEPAVADRDDDREHANRYGVDDEDMFGDGRMVVPPVLDGGDQHGDFGPTGSR